MFTSWEKSIFTNKIYAFMKKLSKKYYPPCAFTPYVTCPLPPKENILPIRITAGEKAVEHFGHH